MTIDAPAVTRAPLWRRAVAELIGTGLLVAVVVGSGIAAHDLSADPGLRLLENSLATALGLGVLAGYWLGDQWDLVEQYVGVLSKVVLVLVVLALAWFIVKRVRAAAGSGRHRRS